MESLDLRVLADALAWKQAGADVTLVTVVETWGSAPRPVGAMLAIRDDGVVSGSVSGGCIEDDLIARIKSKKAEISVPEHHSEAIPRHTPSMIAYGVTKDEAARFGLPCGGTLRLVQEPVRDTAWIRHILQQTAAHTAVARTLNLATGEITLRAAQRGEAVAFDGTRLTSLFGPKWRMLIIGAGQLSQATARMAQMLDFEVLICDPRTEYAETLLADASLQGVQYLPGMPDDVVREMHPDAHTAIVALTHDSKLDDMALMEALASDTFYVGALGSARNQATRKARFIEHFDMNAAQLSRLHGPIGLRLGAKTPTEIAVSIIAQVIEQKYLVCQNSISLSQPQLSTHSLQSLSSPQEKDAALLPQAD